MREDHEHGYCWNCGCHRWRGQLTTLKKISTREYRSRIQPSFQSGGQRGKCWNAVLDHFDVPNTPTGKGEYTSKINEHMRNAGYTLERISLSNAMPAVTQDSAYTLAAFFGTEPEGDWLIYGNHHVMCVRNGKITDTMGMSASVGRRIGSLYRVTRNDTSAPVTSAVSVQLAASASE